MKHHHRIHDADPHHLTIALLWELVIPMLIGMALAALAMLAMRRAGLRWTWAALAAPIAWLAWLIDPHVGLMLATAVVGATGAGAKWHWDDVERGGSEKQAAKERVGPLRWSWTRLRAGRVSEKRAVGDQLAIGMTRRGRISRIPFGVDRGVHGIVLGATGSGKTVTQTAIAQAYILAGLPVIAVDPKGDGFLREVLAESTRKAGRRFREWEPFGKTVYNPFARGGPTEVADKALAGHSFSDDHYRLITQRLLGQALATMKAAGEWPPTLSTVVRYMDPERLDDLASRVDGDVKDRVSSYVDGLTARHKADLSGGRDQLAVLAEGELGPYLDPSPTVPDEFFDRLIPASERRTNLQEIKLDESFRSGETLYIRTESDRYPEAARLLGAAIIIDLVTLTADLRGREFRGLVLVDEFSAVSAEKIFRLFGRARDAGMSILLGTQSLADLRSARPDDPSDTLTEQVLTNLEFAVVHRQSDPASAERLAQMAGTEPSWATTRRVTGIAGFAQPQDGTRIREREFLVNPDEFKRLKTGEAVVINPTAKAPAEIVRIRPTKEIDVDPTFRIE
jgi:type IV secretory pathway TraG/TraD family ATPase VirD4